MRRLVQSPSSSELRKLVAAIFLEGGISRRSMLRSMPLDAVVCEAHGATMIMRYM
jgi:hypothetical protein